MLISERPCANGDGCSPQHRVFLPGWWCRVWEQSLIKCELRKRDESVAGLLLVLGHFPFVGSHKLAQNLFPYSLSWLSVASVAHRTGQCQQAWPSFRPSVLAALNSAASREPVPESASP